MKITETSAQPVHCSHIAYPTNFLFGVNVEYSYNDTLWRQKTEQKRNFFLVQTHFSFCFKTEAERRKYRYKDEEFCPVGCDVV
jgi:hypothetical protein